MLEVQVVIDLRVGFPPSLKIGRWKKKIFGDDRRKKKFFLDRKKFDRGCLTDPVFLTLFLDATSKIVKQWISDIPIFFYTILRN